MKAIGAAVASIGAVGVTVSALADYIGLNVTQDNPDIATFGWLQMSLVALGVAILLTGIVILVLGIFRKKAEEEPSPVFEDEEDTDQETFDEDDQTESFESTPESTEDEDSFQV